MKKNLVALVLTACVVSAFASTAVAQDALSASPVVTGFTTQDNTFSEHEKKFNFGVNPVVLVPVGREGLFLTEWEFGYDLHREDGKTEKEFEYGLEYLQLNQPFSRRFTGIFGKFLTPGMWNERLHPSWIKKTSYAPFTAGLLPGSGTGLMVKGALPFGQSADLTYSPFFTAAISNKYFDSERMVGGRTGLFLKNRGLDVGFLAARSLQNEQTNTYGVDLTYQLRDAATDLRGEYYSSSKGSAYWLEASKRFKELPVKSLRRLELAVRYEYANPIVTHEEHEEAVMPEEDEHHHGEMDEHETDTYADGHDDSVVIDDHKNDHRETNNENGHHGDFPEIRTNRLIGSINYYVRDGWKLYLSHGRKNTPGSGMSDNVWNFGLAIRFVR